MSAVVSAVQSVGKAIGKVVEAVGDAVLAGKAKAVKAELSILTVNV